VSKTALIMLSKIASNAAITSYAQLASQIMDLSRKEFFVFHKDALPIVCDAQATVLLV